MDTHMQKKMVSVGSLEKIEIIRSLCQAKQGKNF